MLRFTFLKWLTLVALISLGCTLSAASTTAVPTTMVQPTSPALTTYTNTAFGYSIDYPKELRMSASADQALVWIDQQISVVVSPFSPEAARGDGPVIQSAADIQVGAYPARRLVGGIGAVGGNTPQHIQMVVIPHSNQYVVFTVYELRNDVALPMDRVLGDIPADKLALFEQVVASVRFTG